MQLTTNESTFLDMIKKTCVDNGVKYSITPSAIGVIGIMISNWGTSKEFFNTRNIYLLPANDDWYGKCYSKYSEKVYDKVSDCKELGPILYRVYDDHRESIKDFIYHLVSARRSKDGPLRYQSIIGCTDYKETVDKLVRNGFMQEYLNRVDDVAYINTMISIIEKYGLYEWDDSLKEENNMSKKKRFYNNQNGSYNNTASVEDDEILEEEDLEETEEESVEDDTTVEEPVIEHMYRVRLDWDKRDTQIFASPSYEDALEAALKHEGYKIYIDDDGELFEDPWANKKAEEEEEDKGPKPNIHVLQGEPIILNNTPIYRSAIDKSIMAYMTGKFYFYDSTIVNGRAKISKTNDFYNKNPRMILGYINIKNGG